MTQDEINQLHALLNKAKALMPEAQYIDTIESNNGVIRLSGTRCTIFTGSTEDWLLVANGNVFSHSARDIN